MDTSSSAALGGLIALVVNYLIGWVKAKWFSGTPVVPVDPVPVTPSAHPIIDGFLKALEGVLLSKVSVPTSIADFHTGVPTEEDVVKEFAAKLK